MGDIGTLRANALLNVMFGGIANPFPATYYLGLSSTLPTVTGTNVTEPAGGGYARVAFANNTTTFPGAADRGTLIAVPITFAVATGSWGAALGWFVIYDHLTASLEANFVGFGSLGTTQVITAGGIANFPANSLNITVPIVP